mmetsp:Transcript_24385/g.57340  ORF Transcript_24385/g.57340 Transcript_24385/m.57340 type:complete len:262 (+) Transcript_24385:885-1670(+)
MASAHGRRTLLIHIARYRAHFTSTEVRCQFEDARRAVITALNLACFQILLTRRLAGLQVRYLRSTFAAGLIFWKIRVTNHLVDLGHAWIKVSVFLVLEVPSLIAKGSKMINEHSRCSRILCLHNCIQCCARVLGRGDGRIVVHSCPTKVQVFLDHTRLGALPHEASKPWQIIQAGSQWIHTPVLDADRVVCVDHITIPSRHAYLCAAGHDNQQQQQLHSHQRHDTCRFFGKSKFVHYLKWREACCLHLWREVYPHNEPPRA